MDSILAAAYDRLLSDPKFAPGLSSERRSELLADPDLLFQEMQDEASSVLRLGWDGGFPGTSGASWLQEWHGLYFVTSSDFDNERAYWSLDEALASENFNFSTARPELHSDVIPMDRLMEIALGLVDEDDTIGVNGQYFIRRSDRLEPVEDVGPGTSAPCHRWLTTP